MKKSLLILLLALNFSIASFSQQGNTFKSFTKNQSGTTHPTLHYKTISYGSNTLKSKSYLKNGFNVASNLKYPQLKKDTIQDILYKSGIPIFFKKEKVKVKSSKTETIYEQFYAFHNDVKQTTGISNPKNELIITQKKTDELGITHVKAQQYFKGIKVYGAESFVHIGDQMDIFNGRVYSLDTNLNVIPNLTIESVSAIVESDLRTKTMLKDLSTKEKAFLNYDSPDISLIIFNSKLAYEISIRPNFLEEWKYYVDAQSGIILKSFNNTQSDGPVTATGYDLKNVLRPINTFLDNGSYFLINASESMYNAATNEGAIYTLNANNTSSSNLDYSLISSINNTWTNKTAVSAHYNATSTYKYFKNTFGRNSLNGQGGNIISFINVSNEDGSSMDNAFWNGKAIYFGNGDSYFSSLAGALDVTAHEFGHGVISNSANLEYYEQSGAINEAYADIFGSMVDRDDWLIGEDITKTTFSPSGALRNMADPHNLGTSGDPYWQPNHVSEMYLGAGDNGGVHINSGIVNYAFYLYATAISKEKAEQVFYRALTNYLTSKTQFIDLRLAIVQSAKDLYGDNSQEVFEADKAFETVGIYEENSIDYAQDYPVNPGKEYLLAYNTDPADPNMLYRASTDGTSFDALTKTSMKRKASVSDDGTFAVFVASDNKIKALSTDPSAIQEFYLSDEAFFDNVTVSKDGNRIAAISTEVDTAIYVYDFISKKWAKFKLFNPTTSENGINSGGVAFADAIEFDHTGEYLMYDAFNVINSTSGDNISYWDIGFIRVWDNLNNDFGDGNILKLYESLPENVSIGNASFSKNSPYIIAFDYINSATKEYAIFGGNLLTGDLGLITTNTTPGYPTFSNFDTKIAFAAQNTSDKEVIATIGIEPDKITGSGSASILFIDATYPIFYTEGNRSLNLEPIANFTVDLKSGVAPLTVKYTDLSINDPISWNWVFEGGTPGTSSLQNPSVIYNSPGIYSASLTCTNIAGNNTIKKTSYISVTLGTEINEQTKELFSIYPNPTQGVIIIDSEKDYNLKIYSLSGNLMINVKNEKEIDLSKLTKGLYILEVNTNGKTIRDKIVKQ